MDSVAWTAKKEYGGRLILLEGPIKLVAEFYLPRSGNHYGTGKNARNLKGSAPKYHIKKPDLDKLVRAIQDSLTKVIWQDDKQIVDIEAHKYYETNDTPPGVSICVREIELSENQLRVLDSVKEKDNLFNTKS
jgi:Holliday junction resolvase RusA-like endonuclease